jgi:hypothetical protein
MKAFKVIIVLTSIASAIGCTTSSQQPQLGNGYRIYYNQKGRKLLLVNSTNDILIKEQVLSYKFDSTFIVILQKPLDSVLECKYENNETLSDCKEAFEKSKLRQYWIINKKQKSIFNEMSVKYSNVYGPFNRQAYLNKLKEFKIPQNLVLKEE